MANTKTETAPIVRGRPGRKKSTIPLHDLHVHINRDIFEEAQAHAASLDITMRVACEKALALFLLHEATPKAKTRHVERALASAAARRKRRNLKAT